MSKSFPVLSGHADHLELTQWLQQSALTDSTRIQLIHGDPEALEGMRVHLQEHTAFCGECRGLS
ncbi:MBL fold metallo-hydrolase RNA specificity domain-containing protein [Halopseudomonas pachastrellae]|nr:MBL fold metallo-hydrolase RNA specificity domain-containing protein [Halopseudomonas pachastrellae]